MVFFISVLAAIAALTGILSAYGPGEYKYESIRKHTITIYGRGVYQHMSSDVAIQGIAQDYITLFAAIPLLIISFFFSIKGSLRWKYIFSGTLGYFLVTYLFYMCMGMYNELFLVYVALTSLSFYAFLIMITSFDLDDLSSFFSYRGPEKFTGGFLIFCSIAIAFMWLGVVVPPLLDKSIYPLALSHYTTLIVQGLDLAILLPASFLSGLLIIRQNRYGYLLTPVYIVFLSLLMTALTSKVIGMSLVGVSAGPALVIIPLFNLIAVFSAALIIRNIKEHRKERQPAISIY